MAIITYVCIDTNAFFRYVTQATPGYEQEHLDKLKAYMDDGTVLLLLPEVIKLELENQLKSAEQTTKKNFAKAEKEVPESLKKLDLWNELDVEGSIKQYLRTLAEEKQKGFAERTKRITEFLDSTNLRHLDLTVHTLLGVRKRILAGRVVKEKSGQLDPDLCIIEILCEELKGVTNAQMVFCTENKQDFVIEIGDKEKTSVIHPALQQGLPPTEVVHTLKDVVEFIDKNKQVDIPTEEVLEEAVKRGSKSPHAALQDLVSFLDRQIERMQLENSLDGSRLSRDEQLDILNEEWLLNDKDDEVFKKWEVSATFDLVRKCLTAAGESELTGFHAANTIESAISHRNADILARKQRELMARFIARSDSTFDF